MALSLKLFSICRKFMLKSKEVMLNRSLVRASAHYLSRSHVHEKEFNLEKIDGFLVLGNVDLKPEFLGQIALSQTAYDHFKPEVQDAIRLEGYRYVKYVNDWGGYNRIFPYSNDFGRFCAVNDIKNDYVLRLMRAIEDSFGIDPSSVAQVALCWEINADPAHYGTTRKATRVDGGYQGRRKPPIGDFS